MSEYVLMRGGKGHCLMKPWKKANREKANPANKPTKEVDRKSEGGSLTEHAPLSVALTSEIMLVFNIFRTIASNQKGEIKFEHCQKQMNCRMDTGWKAENWPDHLWAEKFH